MSLFRILRERRARRFSAPLPQWRPEEDAGRGHIVQFYGGAFPTAEVATFLLEGIEAGEVCIVIAEPGHITAIDRKLDRPGKCIYLDAEETLAKFMVGGRPDRVRFMDTVGDLVAEAAQAGGGRVRAFGEMVVLLCERGDPEAAHQLEAMWNELGKRHQLRLLCSYPIGVLEGRGKAMAAPLRDSHSHSHPAA